MKKKKKEKILNSIKYLKVIDKNKLLVYYNNNLKKVIEGKVTYKKLNYSSWGNLFDD